MSQPVPESTAKPSLTQRGKDRTAERAAPIIAAALPTEQVLVGARAESGPSSWWILLSSYIVFFRKYWYIALTDHHVVLCSISRWSGRPKEVAAATPRGQVQVTNYQPGALFSTFRYGYPEREKPLRMRVHRVYRAEIESLLGQIGAFGLGPGQPPAMDPAGLPPGQYAPPPGQYAPPPGQYAPPPGQYGPPPGQPGQFGPPPGQPGQYGPPPGQYGPPPGQPGQYGPPAGRPGPPPGQPY